MSGAIALLRSCALGVLAICYIFLSHYTLTMPGHAMLGTLVAVTPIVLAMISLAWNTRYRFLTLALILAAITLLLNWQRTAGLQYHRLYWAEHAGTQMLLCVMFARTLRPGRESLCTVFARIVHGMMNPALERYTRQVTFAWAVFFALMALLSTAIFFAMPIRVWSIFANFFTAPLTCSMFVAEYAVRRTRHLDIEHVSILAAVKAFWKTSESR